MDLSAEVQNASEVSEVPQVPEIEEEETPEVPEIGEEETAEETAEEQNSAPRRSEAFIWAQICKGTTELQGTKRKRKPKDQDF